MTKFDLPCRFFTGKKFAQLISLILFCFLAILPLACRKQNALPNIVLVIIDTLRADMLGVYGNTSGASKELDHILQEGVIFEHAYSQASWTRASIASLLSGLHPKNIPLTQEKWDPLPLSIESLPESLQASGYYSIGLTSNPQLNKDFKFEQGFSEYYESSVTFSWMKSSPGKSKAQAGVSVKMAPEMLAKSKEVLKSSNRKTPLYLQILLMDVHAHHKIDESDIDTDLIGAHENRYTQAVRNATRPLASFIEESKKILGPNTIFIITSDHGEGLSDHPSVDSSNRHGNLLYESHIKVPLILIGPERYIGKNKRVTDVVRLVDMYPTIADWLAMKAPQDLEGLSLAPLLRGDSSNFKPRLAFSETSWRKGVNKKAVTDGKWLFVHNEDGWAGTTTHELHRIGEPQDGSRSSKLDQHPEEAQRLRQALEQHFSDE